MYELLLGKVATTPKKEPLDGFGNHVYLEKQDKIREIGVDVPTSQIVVVGSQSSGKSSLLENLTGFAFPRSQGVCTRYATQITLRRNADKYIVISIIPWRDSDSARKDRLRGFRYELDEFDPKELADIIEKANTVMGIRPSSSEDEEVDMSLPMFSDDILRVEIAGPDQPHLTVIDVPGLFEFTGKGGTTELDKTMVANMVRRYMENERTIVLAVLSCLSDLATEPVLQLAKTADPDGVRTVGVLTKADLVHEQAVVKSIEQVVNGNTLKLGYFVVRNRGADEDDLSIAECQAEEKKEFAQPQWAELAKLGRTGVEGLRARLQVLLVELARRELPKQRAEVDQRLSDYRKMLEVMGAPRESSASQREILVKLASKFERLVRDALDGRYEGSSIFQEKPELKLATRIVDLNEGFSNMMLRKGHTWRFVIKSGTSTLESQLEYERKAKAVRASISSMPELQQIVGDNVACAAPSDDPIMEHIEKYYKESRGPELGTFGGTLLAVTFRAQASKWPKIVMAHVETVVMVVHGFIKTLLAEIVVDQRMREELWDSVLLEELKEAYCRAKSQAEFLLDIELNSRPSTYNHYFNDNLQKDRIERVKQGSQKDVLGSWGTGGHAPLTPVVTNKSNAEHVKEDIHDILKSYYKVSRKRFVDVVCRQVIEHFLLDGHCSPLKVLTPELITTMTDEQLDMIAGEDAATRRERKHIESEIQLLEAAMKVLRG